MTESNLIPDETLLQLQFLEFHKNNPKVYELLKYYVEVAIEAGRSRYSINGLFERIRWSMTIETRGVAAYKMNNNYRSRYARLLMKEYPQFEGFFEIRELKA